MKRIFVAIPISLTLQRIIMEWEQHVDKLPVRWIPGKNLHVTLVPPWYEEDSERTIQAFGTLTHQFRQFHIVFDKVCPGPDPRSPRLIWAEGQESSMLAEVKATAEKLLQRDGPNRPFRAHLTLARINERNSHAAKKINEPVEWRETVKTVALIEVRLLPDGAAHEILKEIPLGG